MTLTATADTGYTFTGWSGDLSGTTNPTTITLNGDKTVGATFTINTFTLTYTAGTGGTLTGVSPQTVNYGESGTLVTAVANTGYHFVSWSDGVLTAARTDSNVMAKVGHGYLRPGRVHPDGVLGSWTPSELSQPAPYYYGNQVILTMGVVDPGYTFTGWSEPAASGPAPAR